MSIQTQLKHRLLPVVARRMQAVRQASGDLQGQIARGAGSAVAPSAGEAAADRKWLAASEKALGFLQAANPRIVGVTGDRRGAGCTSLARALAKAYGLLGRRVLFIDATATNDKTRAEAGHASDTLHPIDLLTGISLVDGTPTVVLRDTDLLRIDARAFRSACDTALKNFDLVILDLPPLAESLAAIEPAARVTAPVCDKILLVCRTENAIESELKVRLQVAKLMDYKMAGVVLNDYGVKYSSLLAGSAS
jgi:Mrp family chromosome partitioning ATPase